MNKFLPAIFLSTLLFGACGGGGDNGTNTGSIDTGDTGTVADVDNFVAADGNASYSGERRFASLSAANSRQFLHLLFSPGLSAPGTVLRRDAPAVGVQLVGADFLRAQETMLKRLKHKALVMHQYHQRAVDTSDPDSCQNAGGNVRLSGHLFEDAGKGKLKLEYVNCESGGYVLNGDAYLLIYAVQGGFNQFSSITLSYNGLNATLLASGETLEVTGTIDEVADFNTNSTRVTTTLHRQISGSSQQSLTRTIRQLTGGNGAVNMSGDLYDGFYGRARITTVNPLLYNDAGSLLAGYIVLTGAGNSKMAVTALGEQFNPATNHRAIMLQVDIDANGDGVYENISQIEAGGL